MTKVQAFKPHFTKGLPQFTVPCLTLDRKEEGGTAQSSVPSSGHLSLPCVPTVKEGMKLAGIIFSVLTEQMRICSLTLLMSFPPFYKGTFSSFSLPLFFLRAL